MNQSKNIFERIRLYRINSKKKNKETNNEKIKKVNQNNIEVKKKPYSKIKIFFKTIFGLFVGIFEYLVMKINKKNPSKNNTNKHTENIIENQELNIETKKESSNNINQVEQIKKVETNSITKSIEIKNVEVLENNKNIELIFPKKLVKKEEEIKPKAIKKEESLQEKKNKLIIIEDQIIYADSLEELEITKNKILGIKKSLINEKSNDELRTEKTANINTINNYTNEKSETLYNADNSTNINNSKEVNEELKENIDKEKGLTEQKLITRCDEDLVLIEEKKKNIEFQEQYEKKVNESSIKKEEFKITKKDLKQIKSYVDSILRKQQQNFDSLKLYMNTPSSTKLFMARLNNCIKSTAKLSLSFIPFFSFPNKLLGLVTSSLFINNSLRSYRFKPNKTYLNQNLKIMISSYECCLKSGIRLCEDSLNEIDNIKYYLNNLPSNVKDTYEYRKYLLDVISTEKQVKTQIQTLNKFSKNYSDIKVKVKKREY